MPVFTWVLGSEFRSSCLYSKHFDSGASPSSQIGALDKRLPRAGLTLPFHALSPFTSYWEGITCCLCYPVPFLCFPIFTDLWWVPHCSESPALFFWVLIWHPVTVLFRNCLHRHGTLLLSYCGTWVWDLGMSRRMERNQIRAQVHGAASQVYSGWALL